MFKKEKWEGDKTEMPFDSVLARKFGVREAAEKHFVPKISLVLKRLKFMESIKIARSMAI